MTVVNASFRSRPRSFAPSVIGDGSNGIILVAVVGTYRNVKPNRGRRVLEFEWVVVSLVELLGDFVRSLGLHFAGVLSLFLLRNGLADM